METVVEDGESPVLGPLPPHLRLADFLAPAEHGALLDWVLANRERFAAGTVNYGRTGSRNRVDPAVRVAQTLQDLGPIRPILEQRLLGALPEVMRRIGPSGPPPRSLELELAAHGDGAHFAAHLDIPVGPDRRNLGATSGEDRVISAVYYFHAEPKRFSGGELRLFRFGVSSDRAAADPANYIDLEPLQNSLVCFPSWVRHEVRAVSCPSQRFDDYRFALNCWYCRSLGRESDSGSEPAASE